MEKAQTKFIQAPSDARHDMKLPNIVIVGRPNVGKSTLFNRLSRSKNALVDDRPGVTRDRLHVTVSYDGIPFVLTDTGGFEDIGQDPMLEKVRAQVKKAIKEADRVIFMVDGGQGIMPGDEEMAAILRRTRKKIFLAVNKVDGPENDHLTFEFFRFGIESVHPVSAAHGYGIKSFVHEVITGLPVSTQADDHSDQIRVAVLGRPNVGKSSFINRILGSDRLLVSDLPGTTRDTVDTAFSYHGREYLLIDTAGIRRKARVKEKIEKFSMIKALNTIKRCHIAVIILDASQEISEQDARICGYAFEHARGLVLAVNKWDMVKKDVQKIKAIDKEIDRQLKFVSFAPRVNVSALTGENVMKIFNKIELVHRQFSQRINTSAVNKAIGEMIEKHPPPRIGKGRLKFFYATQAEIRPPTFITFVNRPDMIHFSYERFLINQIRSHFQLDHTPIKLKVKEK